MNNNNNNYSTKALIFIGAFLFVIDHPLLFSLGCLAYFVIQNINIEETMALKNYINNGNDWVKELNQQAREIEVPLTTPRNILSELWDRIQNEFTSEQIQSLQNNSFVQNKVIDVIKKEFEESTDTWENYSMEEWIEDGTAPDNLSLLIKRFLPKYNFSNNFTQEDFKQLIKNVKVAVRNPDGSIKNKMLHEDLEFFQLQLLKEFKPMEYRTTDNMDIYNNELYIEFLDRDFEEYFI